MRSSGILLILALLLTVLFPPIAVAAPRYTVIPLAEERFRFDRSSATAINRTGQIAGVFGDESSDQPSVTFGFSIYYAKALSIAEIRGPAEGTGTFVSPAGINAGGVVAGSSNMLTPDGVTRAFVIPAGGTMTDLGSLDGDPAFPTYANAINDAGQIVGRSHNTVGFQAFLYSGGVMTNIDLTGGASSVANAINDRGEIVGQVGDYAFRYSGGKMDSSILGPAGSASDINNHGQIVGRCVFDGSPPGRAFLFNSKMRITDLGTLGGPFSDARSINDHGEIVGVSTLKKSSVTHAFFSTGEGMVDLNSLLPADSKWIVLGANAINDAGLIVGYGRTAGDPITKALLIAPMPKLTVLGGTNRVTHAARITLHGRADRSVARVTYARKKNRNFLARGAARWHLSAKLHRGQNVILVTARGFGGNSTTVRVTVTRT